jgi:hypothetical protein
MNAKTIQFDQVQTEGEGVEAQARVVNPTDVPASADGETVSFTLPDGAVWSCDQEALAALLGTQAPVPMITLDRAKALADAAVTAGLAEAPTPERDAYSFSPVLRAKLGDLGVEKITDLNVDQAEAVEAFIAEEAAALVV